MTPRDHARKFYGAEWYDLLDYYVGTHFVYASPTCLVLAKEVDDYWFIEWLSGDPKEALEHLPYWLPRIAYARRGVVRSHWTATLVSKLLPSVNVNGMGCLNDSVQDGFDDPLSRGRRGRWQDQTSASPIAHHGG